MPALRYPFALALALSLPLAPASAPGGEVEVVAATAAPVGRLWRFDVTLRHGDTGWDHYADGWRVKGADGTVYGTRDLLHPHVNEQPFTRSLTGVRIPPGVQTVIIEARDNVHGWSEATLEVALPR